MLMALPSVASFTAALAAAVVAGLSLFLVRKPEQPEPFDPDREYKRLETRLRHPWKARASRWLGVD